MTSRPNPSSSLLTAAFSVDGGRTNLARLHEAGALRLRRPNGTACEAMIVNTGGGIVGGDRLTLEIALAPAANVTITSVAAEKIYRSGGPSATIETRLGLGPGACLDWLPQETILFAGAHLDRRFAVDMAADASLLAAETIVFGRLASGETSIGGALRDGWRIQREGKLVFADETRLEGAIGSVLDKAATGAGARAVSLVLLLSPKAESFVDAVRVALETHEDGVDAGASARDRLLCVRLVSRDPERLRLAMTAVIGVLRGRRLPRGWG